MLPSLPCLGLPTMGLPSSGAPRVYLGAVGWPVPPGRLPSWGGSMVWPGNRPARGLPTMGWPSWGVLLTRGPVGWPGVLLVLGNSLGHSLCPDRENSTLGGSLHLERVDNTFEGTLYPDRVNITLEGSLHPEMVDNSLEISLTEDRGVQKQPGWSIGSLPDSKWEALEEESPTSRAEEPRQPPGDRATHHAAAPVVRCD